MLFGVELLFYRFRVCLFFLNSENTFAIVLQLNSYQYSQFRSWNEPSQCKTPSGFDGIRIWRCKTTGCSPPKLQETHNVIYFVALKLWVA